MPLKRALLEHVLMLPKLRLGGMVKMWRAEAYPFFMSVDSMLLILQSHESDLKPWKVLGKFPVIQHFLFGPTLQWPAVLTSNCPSSL